MRDANLCANRIARLRALAAKRGYDAVIIRDNANLTWLTGFERAFDSEVAHTALITATDLLLHTDSRYYMTFMDRLGEDTSWTIDQEPTPHPVWTAKAIAAARAHVVAIEDSCDLAFFDALTEACNKESTACLMPRLHGDVRRLRMVKDASELALLRRAQEITDEAFEYICGYLRPGLTELEVRAELENYMLSHGADTLSFDTILASGPNGANPHAQPGDRVLQVGDMVVMDYGAGYHDYHADMTRTVCLGQPTDEQVRVYNIVKEAHEKAAAAVHPGVNGKDIHQISVDVISEAGYGDYYGHGLGHGVGIEIHEWPGFGRSWDEPVPAGSVVTIEPGIYLPGNFGVRLEDCGVVTENGYEPFTASAHELRVIDC